MANDKTYIANFSKRYDSGRAPIHTCLQRNPHPNADVREYADFFPGGILIPADIDFHCVCRQNPLFVCHLGRGTVQLVHRFIYDIPSTTPTYEAPTVSSLDVATMPAIMRKRSSQNNHAGLSWFPTVARCVITHQLPGGTATSMERRSGQTLSP